MKLSTAIGRFDDQMRADGRSPITREVHVRDLRRLQEWLGSRATIEAVTPRVLTRYLNSDVFVFTKTGKPRTPVTVNRSKSAIRTFFRFLTDAGYLKANPARLVKLARTPRKPPRPMSREDVKRLLAVIKKHKDPLARRDYLMFRLMLATGIRLGAAVGLDVSDLDCTAQTIRILTKGGLEQRVYLSPRLVRELRRYAKGTALFQSCRGHRLTPRQVQGRFSQWLLSACIRERYTVHSLRHTFATRLYEQTRDIRLVQRALGHARVTTTEVYTLIDDTAVHRAVGKLKL